jgi:hypothetical protein
MKTPPNAQMTVLAVLCSAGVSRTPKRAAGAINAPLKDFTRFPKNRSIARSRKTACHRSHFEARRDSGRFNGGLNGFNREFLANRVLGKDFSEGLI